MSAEDFRELENTILTSSMMDGEIFSLMDRAPDFYTEMLPSMAGSANVDNVQQMAEATAEVATILGAAKGRIRLFNIAYKRDQKRMSDHSLGDGVCSSGNSWSTGAHKLRQAAPSCRSTCRSIGALSLPTASSNLAAFSPRASNKFGKKR
jgi:hypothetical protein